MRTSVERWRTGLLAGAVLLVVVIAVFLGYARYKLHRGLADLPGRLGATITKEFNGYTYSQSDGKRTIFTIHAAKAVQHTNGTYSLHDVSMVLYGKKGDRADRISGEDFEYDTKNEVIRAAGIVHLDLEAPQAEGKSGDETAKHLLGPSATAGAHEDSSPGSRVVHIKTSGLVYMKTLGIAATNEGIEFAFGGFTGHAIGAEYNSDTGHVILQSAVTGGGLGKGRPFAFTASHGEFDRAGQVADLDNARYTSAGEIAQTDLAHIHMRTDGTVGRIEGERHVLFEDAEQGSVTSDHADVSLDKTNKPTSALLNGNVHFVDDEPLREAHSDSDRADLGFDAQGRLKRALLAGRVHATERLRMTRDGSSAWSERDLTADTLDLALSAAGSGGRPQLSDANAIGSARLTSVTPDARSGGTATSKLWGDTLVAHLVPNEGTTVLSTVHGAGHTVVEQRAATGIEQTSAGNTLDAEFRPDSKRVGAVELATAVQQGGVVITRTVPATKTSGATTNRTSSPELQHATAATAVFNADANSLTLTGNVQMSDDASTISAARVVMLQDSGNATADGNVKVSYLQASSASRADLASRSSSAEPIHVLAARAELDHDAGRATFHGSAAAGGPGLARMWQPGTGDKGGSQIEAPVLIFEQEQKRLTARAEVPGTPGTVHTTLADSSSAKPSAFAASAAAAKASSKEAARPGRNGVARITSSLMVYSDIDRKAEFSGGVKLLDADGETRAQQAEVFLTPAAEKSAQRSSTSAAADSAAGKTAKPAAASPAEGLDGLFAGSVERIVATGHIEITQPGRKATGERLVYTASDQMYVLTGTAAAPPKVIDTAQGTTTGAALRFHSGDDSVVVSGHDGDAPERKVHTETITKDKRTKQ